jgi:hypothetical protein
MRVRATLLATALLMAAAAASAAAQSSGGAAPVPVQPTRVVAFEADVVFNEWVENDGAGLAQVLLADGTSFTLGAGAALSIDSFERDAATGTTAIVATLHRGVARFVGGTRGAGTRNVALNTIYGTLDLSQAMADVSLGDAEGPPHFDMIIGKEMRLSNDGRLVARVYVPGYSIVPAADGRRARVRRTPPEWQSAIHARLSAPREQPPIVPAAGQTAEGLR